MLTSKHILGNYTFTNVSKHVFKIWMCLLRMKWHGWQIYKLRFQLGLDLGVPGLSDVTWTSAQKWVTTRELSLDCIMTSQYTSHLFGNCTNLTLKVGIILVCISYSIRPAATILILIEEVNSWFLSLGRFIVLRHGDITSFRSTEVFVLDGTHGKLNIRLGKHSGCMVTSVPTSFSAPAYSHGRYFGSGILREIWGHGNKVNKMPSQKCQSPLSYLS